YRRWSDGAAEGEDGRARGALPVDAAPGERAREPQGPQGARHVHGHGRADPAHGRQAERGAAGDPGGVVPRRGRRAAGRRVGRREPEPDWFANLMAHPERASMELPGQETVPVTPQRLEGADREAAWRRIAEAQPRIAKYQSRSDRQYPVVRLTPR